jgi:hypothetical protein
VVATRRNVETVVGGLVDGKCGIACGSWNKVEGFKLMCRDGNVHAVEQFEAY